MITGTAGESITPALQLLPTDSKALGHIGGFSYRMTMPEGSEPTLTAAPTLDTSHISIEIDNSFNSPNTSKMFPLHSCLTCSPLIPRAFALYFDIDTCHRNRSALRRGRNCRSSSTQNSNTCGCVGCYSWNDFNIRSHIRHLACCLDVRRGWFRRELETVQYLSCCYIHGQ